MTLTLISQYNNRYYSRTDDFTNNGANFPNDQVTGYTIRQIENALINERYWDNWRINIINSYNNGTENNLDATFSYWNTK